jgi:hypothetical protein
MKFGHFLRSGIRKERVKRRYPVEYRSWLRWEVGLPLTSPVMIFVLMLVAFIGMQDGPAKALILVSGSGDLLVFSALLLINVGAKFRILDVPRRSKRDFESGDFDPDKPFYFAITILLFYTGIRVLLEAKEFSDGPTIRFIYGIFSAVILLIVVLWIDNVVRTMHTRQIRQRLDLGVIESQYNT